LSFFCLFFLFLCFFYMPLTRLTNPRDTQERARRPYATSVRGLKLLSMRP
jgi:hypothetical protein